MKRYIYLVLVLLHLPVFLWAQSNVGIGGVPVRARLELFSGTGFGTSSAIFGSDGAGISLQQNWPGVGFNQYRLESTGYGRYMSTGYAGVQYLDPANGVFCLDMHPTAGNKDGLISTEFYRAFSILSNGTVSFGKGTNNSNLVVDYLNVNGSNLANGSIHFHGTQYPSFINTANIPAIPTQVGPGKDGGTTYINDISNGNIGIGSTSNLAKKLGINTMPFYLTTLSIKHAATGGGLLLIEPSSFNNWEWYVSNDNPVWLVHKYNGFQIGDYNPVTGVHSYVSDRRLKTDIRPMEPVLDKVMALEPVQYRMKSQAAGTQLHPGFIAQEVKKLFPELVTLMPGKSSGENGVEDLHMLNYSQFFVLSLKAIQEQQDEIAALTKQLEQLEKMKSNDPHAEK
jgi:hypothetical protein